VKVSLFIAMSPYIYNRDIIPRYIRHVNFIRVLSTWVSILIDMGAT
jgi:hypothetical protein